MKLKLEVEKSTIDGLHSDMKHAELELKESRNLSQVYELKCQDLIKQVQVLSAELNSNRRDMITFSQTKEEKDTKIDQLRIDLAESRLDADQAKLKLGTVTIQSEKQQQ